MQLRALGGGDGMVKLGQSDGSVTIDWLLIGAFPEGVEVLGGWVEPWPWSGRW